MNDSRNVLDRLMAVIRDRKENPSERSYTASLFAGGLAKIGAKIDEEAAEVVEAAAETDEAAHDHLVHEAADLVYHLMVLLGYKDVAWREIEQELSRRFGIGGLEEKASR